MFDVAAAGKAILFMAATVMQGIVGLYALGYGAHCFLVVLEQTASGVDEVRWPDEPLLDWLWKLFFLAWLTAFWFVLAWLLVDGVGPAVVQSFPGLTLGQLAVGCVWLLFPISLFSSLSAQSAWVILRGEVLRRLGYHPFALAVVYVMTGLLLAGWVWLGYVAVVREPWLLPVAALLGPAVLLINARLLGRLSWLLNFRTPERRRRRRGPKKPRRSERAVAIEDPWAVPGEGQRPAKGRSGPKPFENLYPWEFPSLGADGEEMEEPEPPPRLPVEGYRVRTIDPPPPAPAPSHLEQIEPIAVQPAPADPAPVDDDGHVQDPLAPLKKVSRLEEELAGRRVAEPPPASPLWSGVYQFPCYRRCIGPWLRLAFGALVVGGLLKMQLEFWPF
jgi:hypothetical protein